MTPVLLGVAMPLPPVEGGEDPDNPLILSTTLSRATSSPFPTEKQERKDDGRDQVLLEEEEYEVATIGLLPSGYSESHGVHFHSPPSTPFANVGGLKSLVYERAAGDADQSYSGSFKWMSSKMRLMVSSDRMIDDKPNRRGETVQIQQKSPPFDDDDLSNNINGSPNTKIRICSDCNTTKTPLWRSGPQGPKSLCNACGIRQRKARRAMAAAAANGGLLSVQTSTTSSSNNKMSKEKIRSGSKNYPTQYRKKFKLGTPRSRKKILFDEFMISLSKNSTFHQVFPQDEKEAAILLMALSCGLVRG